MSVPRSIFEGKFSTYVFGKFFFGTFASWKEFLEIATFIFRNKISYNFVCVDVCILVQKWIIYEAQIFPRSLVQTCWLETTYFSLHTRLSVNKIFQKSFFLI